MIYVQWIKVNHVFGIWYLVFGVWCLVFGFWYFVFGMKNTILYRPKIKD